MPERIARRRWHARRGSTLVELALVASLFFVLLIGAADFGQFLFIQQAIVQRTQAAARWGAATDPTNSAAIRNMVLYAQSTPPPSGKASFGLAESMVTVSTADGGTDNYRLVVQVSGYSVQLLSPYLAGLHQGAPIIVSVPLGMYYQ